jgi:hypothetical protein
MSPHRRLLPLPSPDPASASVFEGSRRTRAATLLSPVALDSEPISAASSAGD